MEPSKITIEGDFWDCQIYRGRLYLWESNGSLRIVNWNKLVNSFINDKLVDELALRLAFLDGRYLYNPSFSILFDDEEVKEVLIKKFKTLSDQSLVIHYRDLDSFTMGVQDNPFQELQTDTEILNNRIYALTYSGVFLAEANLSSRNKFLVRKKTEKIEDFVGYSIKAGKYGRLALSGGSEGLYEYDASEDFDNKIMSFDVLQKRLRKVSDRHSSFADFSYLSLYNSSNLGESFMSLFRLDQDVDFKFASQLKTLEREINESEIFGSIGFNSLSWGTNEKIYKASNNVLEVVNFNNYADNGEYFSEKNQYLFHAWKGRILKGGVAYFGAIIECENALVVLSDEREFYNIKGSVTRWRVYPRSINYENHLHVIHDNCVEICSFNHDYFRSQYLKDFGIKFTELRTNKKI
jgi:hypothetical protein